MRKRSLILGAAAVAVTVAIAAACAKKPAQEAAETTEISSAAEQTTEAEKTEPEETEEETSEPSGEVQEEAGYYMLQGTIVKAASDGMTFTLQADDGNSYDIKLSDICDVETEIKEDTQIAIGCVGNQKDGVEKSQLVILLPEQEEWSVVSVTGTTVSNAMSSFVVKTEDGTEISFMKDNCPIEDGALAADSGDVVEVAYVESQGINYPLEVRKGK